MKTLTLAASIAVFAWAVCWPREAQAGREHLLLVVSPHLLHIFRAEGSRLTPAATVGIGVKDREVCISADGNRAYATNDAEGTVSIVDLNSLKQAGTIDLGPELKRPDGCATSPDSKKLYVASMEANAVAVIALPANKVVSHTKVGLEPRRIVFTPDKRSYLVSSEDGNEITVFDAQSDEITGTIKSGGDGPRTIMFLPDNQTMMVTNVNDDSVSLFKWPYDHPYKTLGAGGSPQRIAISPDGGSAYVLAVLEEKISIFDLKGPHVRAKKFVKVGRAPWGMAESGDRRFLFVGNTRDNDVVVYDTATMHPVGQVSVPSPRGVEWR